MTPTPVEPRRILFLFSDTGGGHRSAAEAIIEALDLEFPGQTRCEMVDFFKFYFPPPFNYASRIYPMLSRMPQLWQAGYRLTDGSRRTRFLNYTVLALHPPGFEPLDPRPSLRPGGVGAPVD